MNGKTIKGQLFFRLTALVLATFVMGTIGCSGMQKNTSKVASEWSDEAVAMVTTTTRLNMAPFAEYLVKLIADIQFGLSGERPVYTRQYLDGPETAEFRKSMQEFKRNLARIIAYSGRVISLAHSNLTGPQRAQALAKFIDVVKPLEKGNSQHKFKYTQAEIDQTLEQISKQDNLLHALQVAQPLVEEAARFLRERVDELKAQRVKVEVEIGQQIDADFSEVLVYRETLKHRQRHNFEMINLLVRFIEQEDTSALKEIAEQDVQLARLVGSDQNNQWTAKDDKAVQLITQRLELIDKHKRFIQGDIDQFRKVLQELEALADASDRALQKAKIAVILWDKAHSRLAAGETDPAKYDFMSVAKFAFDLIM